MRIKALTTLVIAPHKEIAPNGECDLNETDAKSLIERGFAKGIKSQAKPQKQETNSNGTTLQKSDG